MYSNSVVELYSKSFFNCCSLKVRSHIVNEVAAFLNAYYNSVSLSVFFSKNLISNKTKLNFLLDLGLDDILNNLFSILHENGRLNFLFSILEKFLVLVRIDEGEIDVVVTSAVLLSKEDILVISDALKVYCNKKKVKIVNVLDAKILGGIVVKIGYLMFDFSVLRKIEDLSKIAIEALKIV